MFEGETTIKFSKEAGTLIMSQNMSTLFGMPLEVTAMDMTYSGLEVTFRPPQEGVKDAIPTKAKVDISAHDDSEPEQETDPDIAEDNN